MNRRVQRSSYREDIRQRLDEAGAISFRIMVHGGDTGATDKLSDGRTKREQIRDALQELDYVGEVIFASDPLIERYLFDLADATIALIEPTEQTGARFESMGHSWQPGAWRKLVILYPDNLDEPPWGFFQQILDGEPVGNWEYSQEDYDSCRLVRKAVIFADQLKAKTIDGLFDKYDVPL